MTVGIVGYGRFGKLAAGYLARKTQVLVYDKKVTRISSRLSHVRRALLNEVASCSVVILAVPISRLQSTLKSISPHLRPGALVIDVCSVKIKPVQWMRDILPRDTHILGAHPLFGPDSAGKSLQGHRVVLCPVRLPASLLSQTGRILRKEGLHVKVMTPAQHDKEMADSLFLTQLAGRWISAAGFAEREFSTKSYAALMNLVRIADNDSRELFRDMYVHNPYAASTLDKLMRARKRILRDLR